MYKLYMLYNTYVTGFAKRGLPHTSNLPALTIDNFRLERAIALKFGQWWAPLYIAEYMVKFSG